MPKQRLKEYLDREDVKYVSIVHSPAYTAQEVAASAHIPGKILAKTVIVDIDGTLSMAVVPASYAVDFDLLQGALGARKVALVHEEDFEERFPDCELGAMPPFGNLYGMPVIVSRSLAENDEIAFNACTHRELIKLGFKDFERLAQPKVITFSVHAD
ncbi:MAG: YbaK/EbsC family protein [Bacteroidetes bacterium]|nr:YbaK/EbsC family protein [Bacteroidota bacterium]